MQKTNCNKEITKNKAKTNYNAQSKNKKWSGRRESEPLQRESLAINSDANPMITRLNRIKSYQTESKELKQNAHLLHI